MGPLKEQSVPGSCKCGKCAFHRAQNLSWKVNTFRGHWKEMSSRLLSFKLKNGYISPILFFRYWALSYAPARDSHGRYARRVKFYSLKFNFVLFEFLSFALRIFLSMLYFFQAGFSRLSLLRYQRETNIKLLFCTWRNNVSLLIWLAILETFVNWWIVS